MVQRCKAKGVSKNFYEVGLVRHNAYHDARLNVYEALRSRHTTVRPLYPLESDENKRRLRHERRCEASARERSLTFTPE
ncbi:hypothetical protein EVAR_25992_1 [Eumeta japonica]|uniref:Uncharacterized protein n=1 Tax=Eumeta variegata TaxID=151549 RepID=A0A4C1V1H8_EUMVA|nr:hypothetical protein EVAR_25992_1 [Eumeta japonica]